MVNFTLQSTLLALPLHLAVALTNLESVLIPELKSRPKVRLKMPLPTFFTTDPIVLFCGANALFFGCSFP